MSATHQQSGIEHFNGVPIMVVADTRAFGRWSGMSPSSYRENIGA